MKLHVNQERRAVIIMAMEGTCSASAIGEGDWYLNRLLVHPEYRGDGLGPKLLNKLLEVLTEHDDCQRLIVEPGGYGSDVGRLWKFYERYGFVPKEGHLVWTPAP